MPMPTYMANLFLLEKLLRPFAAPTNFESSFRPVPRRRIGTKHRKVLALSASSKAVRRPMAEVCLRCAEKKKFTMALEGFVFKYLLVNLVVICVIICVITCVLLVSYLMLKVDILFKKMMMFELF